MAIKLSTKTNVDAPSANDPYGLVNNNSGSGDGTPVDKDLLHDPLVFFEKMMDEAGVTHNGLHDDEYDGFQLYEAFRKLTKPYDSYTAIIDQTGTGAPTAVVFNENGVFVGDISFSRTDVGIYKVDSAGSVFTVNKTYIMHQSIAPVNPSNNSLVIMTRSSDSQLLINTYVSGALSDNVLSSTNFEVRVYD